MGKKRPISQAKDIHQQHSSNFLNRSLSKQYWFFKHIEPTRRLVNLLLKVSLSIFICMNLVLADTGPDNDDEEIAEKVNQTFGSFLTEIDIDVPEFRGLEPELKLLYNSNGNNGWLGMGWSLGGTSFIQRGAPGGGTASFNNSDAFFLDGEELIPCSIFSGGTHCTKYQSYVRIFRDNANDSWHIWQKDGTKQVYTPVYTWAGITYRYGLTSETDTSGNTVHYGYRCEARECYLSNIDYNGTQILFLSEPRPDSVSYAIGTTFGFMNLRLKAIDIKVDGKRVRSYALNYIASSATGRSMLQSVQEFGSDATIHNPANGIGSVTGGSSLPATRFHYTQGASNMGGIQETGRYSVVNNFPSARHAYDFHLGDFNGDGKMDYITRPKSSGAAPWDFCKLNLSNGNGFNEVASGFWPNWGERVYTGDFNGDNRTDLLVTAEVANNITWGGWVILQSTGAGFTEMAKGTFPSYGENIIVADFNGDSKADVFVRPESPAYGWNGWKLFQSTGTGLVEVGSGGFPNYGERVEVGDFNGDGKSDLFITADSSKNIHWGGWVMHQSTGNSFIEAGRGGWPSWGERFKVSDFNGDGRSDIFIQPSSTNPPWQGWKLFHSIGNGLNEVANGTWPNYGERVDVGDFNGDGRNDLFITADNSVGTSWGGWVIYRTTGEGFIEANRGGWPSWGEQFFLGDFTGDGKSDYLFYQTIHKADGSGLPDWLKLMFSPTQGAMTDLMEAIEESDGEKVEVHWAPSTVWPGNGMASVMPTVKAVGIGDGRNPLTWTTYSYENSRYDAATQRNLGFQKVIARQPDGTFTETHFFQSLAALPGQIRAVALKSVDGKPYNHSDFTYYESNTLPFTSRLSSQKDIKFNPATGESRSTFTEYFYDAYGNKVKQVEHGDMGTSGDERTSLWIFALNTTAFIVDKPAREEMHTGLLPADTATLLRRTNYVYDSRGLLLANHDWINSGSEAITRYEYDNYGNRTRTIDPLGNPTRVVYDPVHNLYPIETFNALEQSTRTTWDYGLGEPTLKVDLNNQEERFYYDTLGRLTKRTVGNLGSETFNYLDIGNPHWQRVRKTISDGTVDGLWEETYQDGLDRVWKIHREGGRLQERIYKDDTKHIWKESLWRYESESPRWKEYTYDAADRLIKTTFPNNRSTRMEYGATWVRKFDELGRYRTAWQDAYGKTTKVQETLDGATYDTYTTYDMLGRLVKIQDAKGNQTFKRWDGLNRLVEFKDANSGTTTYTYNAAGQLIETVDAKGQKIQYTYDKLGRRITNNLGVKWNYDETNCVNGKGRLTSATYPVGSYSIQSYDALGRITKETRTIKNSIGNTTATLDYRYDFGGKLTYLRYPDGEEVTYQYNAAGQIQSIAGYADSFTYDASGEILSAKYPNGVTENFTYDPARSVLTSARVTNNGTSLYDATYTYDAALQILNTRSTTNPLFNLDYSYDKLGRLVGVAGSQTQTFTYDAVGNITSNSQLGAYTYGDINHVHAVTQVGDSKYTYDANGNMTSGPGRNITWDAENRPKSISTSVVSSVSFEYDASGLRVQKKASFNNSIYFGKYWQVDEKPIAQNTKFVYAGGRLIAKRTGNEKLWYHEDQVDTIRVMTDAQGKVARRYEYSAFGELIKTEGAAPDPKGFAGHDLDLETNLIYARARYYDPKIGRFISADPLLPNDEDDPQELNRYSYGLNDPISNNDPTGLASSNKRQFKSSVSKSGSSYKGIQKATSTTRSLYSGADSFGGKSSKKSSALGYSGKSSFTPFSLASRPKSILPSSIPTPGSKGFGTYTNYSFGPLSVTKRQYGLKDKMSISIGVSLGGIFRGSASGNSVGLGTNYNGLSIEIGGTRKGPNGGIGKDYLRISMPVSSKKQGFLRITSGVSQQFSVDRVNLSNKKDVQRALTNIFKHYRK
jgi:RHS repeat-associated protein